MIVALRDWLRGRQELAGKGSIDLAGEGPALPAEVRVKISVPSDPRQADLDGDTGVRLTSVQIDVYAGKVALAAEMATALEELINDELAGGMLAGRIVTSAEIENSFQADAGPPPKGTSEATSRWILLAVIAFG